RLSWYTEATARPPREPLSFVTRDRIVRPTFDCSEGGETVLALSVRGQSLAGACHEGMADLRHGKRGYSHQWRCVVDGDRGHDRGLPQRLAPDVFLVIGQSDARNLGAFRALAHRCPDVSARGRYNRDSHCPKLAGNWKTRCYRGDTHLPGFLPRARFG